MKKGKASTKERTEDEEERTSGWRSGFWIGGRRKEEERSMVALFTGGCPLPGINNSVPIQQYRIRSHREH